MSDVELVVKISESRYNLLQTQARTNLGREKLDEFAEAVLNGTPLPKGHGDLIDINKLPITYAYLGISDKPTEVVNYNCILNAKKIIKADKEQEE